MATKSEKIAARIEAAKAAAAAEIAALEAQAAAAADEERERMRKRVVRAAGRAGLLDTALTARDLEDAFRVIVARPAQPAATNTDQDERVTERAEVNSYE
ncbi:MAG: hypothetical protein K8I04_06840 [Gammaproteobacteria bacterium]|nr:hypothetical protein [Gammaproteobacteria bacterium]